MGDLTHLEQRGSGGTSHRGRQADGGQDRVAAVFAPGEIGGLPVIGE